MKKVSERLERQRAERAVEYVKKRLGLDMHFTYHVAHDGAYMGIDRSPEDSRTFFITFDPAALADQTLGQTRCHALHEILHALSHPLYKVVDQTLMSVPARKRAVLRKQYEVIREDVVRHMERRLGPMMFPGLPWTKA